MARTLGPGWTSGLTLWHETSLPVSLWPRKSCWDRALSHEPLGGEDAFPMSLWGGMDAFPMNLHALAPMQHLDHMILCGAITSHGPLLPP